MGGTRQWVAAGYDLVQGENDDSSNEQPLCATTDICSDNATTKDIDGPDSEAETDTNTETETGSVDTDTDALKESSAESGVGATYAGAMAAIAFVIPFFFALV